VVGDTDENKIRSCARDLLAAPTGRTFCGALLSTDPFPHMLHAPTGEALFAIIAWVEEAAISGVAQPAGLFHDVGEEEFKPGVEDGNVDAGISAHNVGNFRRAIALSNLLFRQQIEKHGSALGAG